MSEYDLLEIEYRVFSRMRDHWKDFEDEGLPVALDKILNEIYSEQCDYLLDN